MARLSNDERIRAVVLKGEGHSYQAIADQLGTTKVTIIRLLKKYRDTGNINDLPGRGRNRKTTVRQDRKLVRASLKNRRLTARDLMVELEIPVTVRTVRNRLREVGLKGRVAAKKPLLTLPHRLARLDFAKAHSAWTPEDWQKVLWSDESSFEIFDSHRRVYVRRRDSEKFNEECIGPTVKFGGGKVMVWGCFAGSRVGELVRVKGTMDQMKYLETLSGPMMRSADALFHGNHYIFQQNNAPCHKARRVIEYFDLHGVEVLTWPAQSPDLNPIEHLWGIIKKKLVGKVCRNANEVFLAIEQEWNQLGAETMQKLVESMPRRM